jgi:alkylation response protein AidB-like acyl-CoA dehydrogenase
VTFTAPLRGDVQPQLEDVLERIAAGAADRDREPRPGFPADAFTLLAEAGLSGWNAQASPNRPLAVAELGLVRRVAAADASVGRVFDGHLNAVERLAVQGPADVRDCDLVAVRAGRLWTGVWGGNPAPGEGPPAEVVDTPQGPVLRGVKTFCSGAGGLHRALVLARTAEDPAPVAVWIDASDAQRVEVDPDWYRSSGLRASVSHRVVFHDAPVIAQFGEPGALSLQPWFARDALRTAATWVGMADAALAAALRSLRGRADPSPLDGLAVGRMLTAHATIELWLDEAARAMDSGERLPATALHARAAISVAARQLLDEAARACGSGPFARGEALDRARRDLELFVLQHRLDPMLARDGLRVLQELRS